MKWRLTGRFLVAIVLIVILVVIINILLLVGLVIAQSVLEGPIFLSKETSAEAITRRFQDQVMISNHQVAITNKGKEELVHNKAWIQILDEDGKQIYGYRVPEGVKEKYTPLDIIQMYKYKEINGVTTVFISGKKVENKYYSYFMGFENRFFQRQVLSYDMRDIVRLLKVGSILVICIDGLIALFIGYLFSKRLTQPLNSLIDGIKRLANKEYHINYDPKGIYKDVFNNVNYLSYELKANENERKKLDMMKDEWIGNISHDIKTPLASIQGYAEMMKDAEYHFSLEEMREYAEIIERKSLYLKEVIEDLNLSARLKNKELTLNKKNINIVTLLRNVVIDTLNDAKYSNRNIEFQFSDEIIKLDIDEILIRRAISNLIYNSIVHNDDDVRIKVSVEKGQRTHIRIADNGKGIKHEELQRIFDRYYRGTNTGELHKGSGLGMAIAHDIIQAHDGEIKVNSLIGQGTTIDIHLPK
ncbi:two-component sensor histidine kinase [Paenibacillus baekrokdamisoli]|uniref:histidine kinase n=1 Tax=Paenibacillus baekrokdamisoli TaxID=1712516 RepID=A0A3G9JHZ1_9BACL|nr:HAMP domain-containing sensor histidine kinase [Paenibacillus baekrokdamisoli]MBB3068329.1 signal transduction histidine kinase [Paenibacillus baekrokdamisoli]BBH22629.1 two-component sensor histidine kinase [Paenibacillus baekrokdamisoli]